MFLSTFEQSYLSFGTNSHKVWARKFLVLAVCSGEMVSFPEISLKTTSILN